MLRSARAGGEVVAIGICRIEDGWANQDSVIIRYNDGTEGEIPASRYLEQAYQPPLDTLPWCNPSLRVQTKLTEDELRNVMKAYDNELPTEEKLEEWARAIGRDVVEVKNIYCEVSGDPDPWGMPIGEKG